MFPMSSAGNITQCCYPVISSLRVRELCQVVVIQLPSRILIFFCTPQKFPPNMTTNAQKTGVIPPPYGMEPDFSGDRTELQSKIIVVYVVMTAISTIVLALRLYTRIFIRRTTGWDDALVLFSWMGCVAWLVICFEGTLYGCLPTLRD